MKNDSAGKFLFILCEIYKLNDESQVRNFVSDKLSSLFPQVRFFLCRMSEKGQVKIIEHFPHSEFIEYENFLSPEFSAFFQKQKCVIFQSSKNHSLNDGILKNKMDFIFIPIEKNYALFMESDVPIENVNDNSIEELQAFLNIVLSHLELVDLLESGKKENTSLKASLHELQQIRTHLIRSERLASLGEFARGIAHEINNPITGIMNYAELIRYDIELDSEIIRYAEGIIEESVRIANIIRDLQSFARQDSKELISVSPNRFGFEHCRKFRSGK